MSRTVYWSACCMDWPMVSRVSPCFSSFCVSSEANVRELRYVVDSGVSVFNNCSVASLRGVRHVVV